jgi:hypothetical protein
MLDKHAVWFNSVDLHSFQTEVEVLFDLGHFISSSFPDFSEECRKEVIKECVTPGATAFKLATASLQRFSNLTPDAWFGPKTKAAVKERFCPLPDIQPAGALSRWSFNDLSVWHDMQSLSGFDEEQLYMQACNMWGNPHTPLTFKWWKSNADPKPNLFAHARRIDGPGKILAWHELPPPNASRNVQLEGRFDTGEAWQQLWQLLSTMAHEIGHGLGLHHSPNPTDLMYHSINGTREPAAGDIAAIQRLYGKGIVIPPPDDPPDDPPPDDDDVELVSRTLLGVTKDGRDLIVEYKLEK